VQVERCSSKANKVTFMCPVNRGVATGWTVGGHVYPHFLPEVVPVIDANPMRFCRWGWGDPVTSGKTERGKFAVELDIQTRQGFQLHAASSLIA